MGGPADDIRLDANEALTMPEILELSGLAEAMLRELVDYGALEPVDWNASPMTFDTHCVVIARTAQRLSRDFELDAHALSVVLRLFERIDALEAEVRALRAGAAR